MTPCLVDQCARPAFRRGVCSMHVARIRRHGSTDDPNPGGSPFARDQRHKKWVALLARVVITETCWVIAGKLDGNKGYGRIGRTLAHRLAYERWVGPIPAGLVIDHLCRNRACVRPDHLEPVTIGVNTMRGEGVAPAYAARTHCAEGHPLPDPDSAGRRRCQPCYVAYQSAYNERRRAARGAVR